MLREKLKQEMEETRLAFHQLLDSLPERALDLPSDNPAWTIGEVIYIFQRLLWLKHMIGHTRRH